jgi:ABC-type glycerol-3-phosphate transport system substrate-binding protein
MKGLAAACALVCVIAGGCFFQGPRPLPPREALLGAHGEINARRAAPSSPAPPRATGSASRVTVWHIAHPAGNKLLDDTALARFHASYPGVQLKALFIGEWTVAVQKLTVALVADDFPDIVLVPRDWAAMLAGAGRLLPPDVLLGEGQLAGIPRALRAACMADGTLFALPAGVSCSVLLCNAGLVPDPPATWEAFRSVAASLRDHQADPAFRPVGHYPFVEGLWSAGGDLLDDSGASLLDRPEALETLEWLLSLRDDELMHPGALLRPETGLARLLQGRCAMTVADHGSLPRNTPFQVTVSPVPGKSGPVSRLDMAVWAVIPGPDGASRDALTAVLDWLLENAEPLPDAVAEALPHARAPRTAPGWTQAESSLASAIDRAARYAPEP